MKIFNKENSSWKSGASPSVSFTASGVISLNRSACEVIGLKAGMKVSIAQDEDDSRTLYLFLDKENGFILRDYNKSNSLAFNCAAVTKVALSNYENEDGRTSVRGKLIKDPQLVDKAKYYPIILPKAE